MSQSIVLCKLLQKSRGDSDTKTHIYVLTKCTTEAIELLMTDSYSNKCYKARVSNDEIREAASDLDMSYDECYKQIFTALTTNLAPGFISEINADKCTYKLIKQQQFNVDYIEAKLREVPNNHEMLEYVIELIGSIKQGTTKDTTTDTESDDSTKLNDGVPDEKEQILMKKFAMLLNAKKAKIEQLQEKLAQLQSTESANGSTDEEFSAVTVAAEHSTSGTSTKRTSNSSQTNTKKSKRVIESNNTGDNEDTNDGDADYNAMTQPMSIDASVN